MKNKKNKYQVNSLYVCIFKFVLHEELNAEAIWVAKEDTVNQIPETIQLNSQREHLDILGRKIYLFLEQKEIKAGAEGMKAAKQVRREQLSISQSIHPSSIRSKSFKSDKENWASSQHQ